jgi:hypothetical protein
MALVHCATYAVGILVRRELAVGCAEPTESGNQRPIPGLLPFDGSGQPISADLGAGRAYRDYLIAANAESSAPRAAARSLVSSARLAADKF